MHSLTKHIFEMLKDRANVTIAIKYEELYAHSFGIFTFISNHSLYASSQVIVESGVNLSNDHQECTL